MTTVSEMKIHKMTWRELLDILNGYGIIVENYEPVANTLDCFGVSLDEEITPLEVFG